MSERTFFTITAVTLLFSLVMFLFPQIDLAISQYFYQPNQGFIFEIYYEQLHLNLYRNFLVAVTYGFITLLFLILIIKIWFKSLPISSKTCCFLLLCFLLGPVLIVNHALKNHWGRPRPNQVQEFGGDKIFQPAWVISNQCEKNCSFTSGETANIFCYLALVFVVRRKKLVATLVLIIGGLTIFERIAQGGHFFSDTILSALLDYLVIWLVYHALGFIHISENASTPLLNTGE